MLAVARLQLQQRRWQLPKQKPPAEAVAAQDLQMPWEALDLQMPLGVKEPQVPSVQLLGAWSWSQTEIDFLLQETFGRDLLEQVLKQPLLERARV